MEHAHPDALESTGFITDCSSGISAASAMLSLQGHSLRVYSPVPFPLKTCVKVEDGNRMWIGEVWVCEPGGAGFTLEVDVASALNDVAGVDRLAERFRHERPSRRSAAFDPQKTR